MKNTMKNTRQLIYITIFSILLITSLFTLAELTTVSKLSYDNHLEQSVIMTASYLLACKLVIYIMLTYMFGNMIYNKAKDNYYNQDVKDSEDKEVDKLNNKPNWSEYPEKMMKWKEQMGSAKTIPLPPIEDVLKAKNERRANQDNILDLDIKTKDIEFEAVRYDRKGYIKEVDSVERDIKAVRKRGTHLNIILSSIMPTEHNFTTKELSENKVYRLVTNICDNGRDYGISETKYIKIGERIVYYEEVK